MSTMPHVNSTGPTPFPEKTDPTKMTLMKRRTLENAAGISTTSNNKSIHTISPIRDKLEPGDLLHTAMSLTPTDSFTPFFAAVFLKLASNLTLKRCAEITKKLTSDGGYGRTYWNEKEKTVWWVSADGDDQAVCDVVRALFEKLPSVKKVIIEAESSPRKKDYSPDPNWVCVNDIGKQVKAALANAPVAGQQPVMRTGTRQAVGGNILTRNGDGASRLPDGSDAISKQMPIIPTPVASSFLSDRGTRRVMLGIDPPPPPLPVPVKAAAFEKKAVLAFLAKAKDKGAAIDLLCQRLSVPS